jgi:photosystem II stability/assembly factor-like uncharacterized protein
MKKNVKNIAYIQNLGLLTNEQIKKYLGDIKYLTSDDTTIIYKFIVCCNKCYKITKFCLMINSEILKELNLLIQKNRNLDKCIFFATRSNADSVREETVKNIYYSISALSVVLKGFLNIPPNYVMTIVSDLNTPYYNQIYNTGPNPVYRISELTVEKVNKFVDSGTALDILIGLNDFPTNEFEKLNKILLDPTCKYRKIATFIELETIDIPFVEKLNKKLARTNNIASNVSLCGVTNAYPDIDSFTLYQNNAIQFINFYDQWCKFIKQSIVFNRFSKFNKNNQSSIKTAAVSGETGNQLSTTTTSTSNNNINSGSFFVALSSDGKYGIAGSDPNFSNTGMYYTNNGGKNWELSNIPPNDTGSFNAVALSGSNGIAFPADYFTSNPTDIGIIYTDSGTSIGKNWIQSNINNVNFTNIALSGSNGLASTNDKPGIYYTNDGGKTWNPGYDNNNIQLKVNFSNVYLSGSNGIAIGENGGMWYTIKSGKNWKKSNITGSFNTAALSGKYGIVGSNSNNELYYTSDSGENWKKSKINTDITDTFSISALSSDGKYGIASTYNNGLYYTNDKGQNWTPSKTPTGSGVITSVALSSDGKYGIAGSDPNLSNNGLYYTNDGGKTWTQSTNVKSGGFDSVALSSDGKYGIAGGGSDNGIYHTTTYGKTWNRSTLITN